MYELLWPAALLALPLPWLARRLLPPATWLTGAPLILPFRDLLDELRQGTPGWRRAARDWLALLAWVTLCVAAARPQWVGPPQAVPHTGRDLLLAVDVSGSMAAEDMRIGGRTLDRLSAVKVVLDDFLERRAGDRVGLLLFGQRAYLMTPLTFDRNSVRQQLQDTVIGIAGRETAIGDAIGLAVKRLREHVQQRRVLILLTDGVNTAGTLDPRRAAGIARAEAVRIYTIGIGSESGSRSWFGMRVPVPGAEIDEAMLQEIAEQTGGRYFRARSAQELAGIYAELDTLESTQAQGAPLRPRRELFVFPLGFVLGLVLLRSLAVLVPRRVSA